ncbi:GTP 3',8-cyclase MoaA [Peribacillus frigoritolerans]|uniref:GTP 3',8-cyclase MoaA n=1 Tax=Peribacillus frigoritolerans TaxID=450367 RepID=UPI0019261F21|nr:GTP 3',8-cyclase MoaA [Peribacillus frigoritolerans]MBL3644229.1 GTP 3',8-cyclase MoaA [Bacillus sp. RHFB]MEE3952725.1 GTP 3',8-cyclase MoaA [Peribacillus frigoritolerans]
MNRHIKDSLDRPLRDLRISVIDRCNFRCQYCMPAEIFHDNFQFLPKSELLSYMEIVRLSKLFASLGVKKLRLTGGEPLLRKDLSTLISELIKIDGIEDIGLTTNGVFLKKQARNLKSAGLKRVNISLDSLDDELFKQMNGRGVGIKPVIEGLAAAKEAGLGVKVNMVVKKEINESQILPMARFCKEEGIQLRYIEFMDVGHTNGWQMKNVLTKKELLEILQAKFDLEPVVEDYFGEVAKRFRYKGTTTEVGVITSVSESFCSSCTRARLSANGSLYTCLFNGKGHDLKSLLRSDMSDEELTGCIISLWNRRDDRYSDERSAGTVKKQDKIEMSFIGG